MHGFAIKIQRLMVNNQFFVLFLALLSYFVKTKQRNYSILGENAYEQITKFLQGYVDNELNFNDEDTCQQSCSDYKQTKHLRCADKTMCANERNEEIEKLSICSGQIHDCVDINNDDVEICLAESRTRRYHYLRYNNGQMSGVEPAETCAAVRHVSFYIFLFFIEMPKLT